METFWKTTKMVPAPTCNPPWSCVFRVTQKLLILRPVDEETGISERLGIGTVRYEDVEDWPTAFDDVAPRVITLI
jgi:hypothetical protein